MHKKQFRQFISFILVVTQFLTWVQPSVAAGPAAAAVSREVIEALGTTRSATFNGLSNAPSQFRKSKVADAMERRFTTDAGQVMPKGAENAGAFRANVIQNGNEVVGQIVLAAPTKINAISILKKAAKSKAGKFVLNFPAEALLFFTALGAMGKMQLWNNFSDNPVSWEQHLMAHDPTTAQGQLGYAGIAAFMLASRGTEAQLYKLIGDSPRGKYFTPFVPYAGMSIGLLASTIVHELHNLPQLKACTMALEKRITEEEKWELCERAYDSFNEIGYEKLQGLAPILFAMFSSTALAGFVEMMTVRKVLTVMGWQILWNHKATAAELGSLLTPAGWGIRGARFLYRVTQFVGQTAIQFWQEPAFTTWWKNFSDGLDLSQLETDIMNQLNRKKRIGWNAPTKDKGKFGDLHLSLAKLSQYSMDWRKGNLHYTIIRHQNWIQYLTNFSSMYTASMNFYNYYINEYRNRYINRVPSKLNELYPLSGIVPLIPQKGDKDYVEGMQPPIELHNKQEYEKLQLKQLIAARTEFEEMINNNEEEYKKIYPDTLDAFKKVLALLPTEAEYLGNAVRMNDISTAIDTVNKKLDIKFDGGIPFYLLSNQELEAKAQSLEGKKQAILWDPSLSVNEKQEELAEIEAEFLEEMDKNTRNHNKDFPDDRNLYSYLRKSLGNPMPIKMEGYGFIKAYQEAGIDTGLDSIFYPRTESLTDDLNNEGINGFYSGVNTGLQLLGFASEHTKPFKSQNNTIVYHHATQYLASQIAFGPRADRKESAIGINRRGFPVQFKPPRLVDSYTYDILLQETNKVSKDSKATIFNTPVVAAGANGSKVRYNNIMDIILAQNIMPSILNHKDGFIGWWKENLESQYIQAWAKFEDEYQRVMVEIYEQYKYYNPGYTLENFWPVFRKSGFSSNAPLSNGLQLSFRQERRLYLLILGEMLKDYSEQIGEGDPLLALGGLNEQIPNNYLSLKNSAHANTNDHDLVNFYCEKLEPADKNTCLQNREKYLTMKRQLNAAIASNKGQISPTKQMTDFMNSNSADLWPKNTTNFIKILDHLKSIENYSFSSILRSYQSKHIIPTKDKFATNKFKMQEDIEQTFKQLEGLLDTIKITEVVSERVTLTYEKGERVSYDTTKKILTSPLTNQQFRDAQNKIDKILEENKAKFDAVFSKVNPQLLPIIRSSFSGLSSIAQQTAELGRMINAVSYEKSDEKDQQQNNNVCDKNSFVATKIGLLGVRTQFTRKACKNRNTQPAATTTATTHEE